MSKTKSAVIDAMNRASSIQVERPKKLWVCIDCGTHSDVKTASRFHLGCVGQVASPKPKYWENRIPEMDDSGEIIYVLKPEYAFKVLKGK